MPSTPANTPLRLLALAVLRSYSLIFFSQHRGFAALLLLLSFANPGAGAAGLTAALLAAGGAWLLGFDREVLKTGAYSFNALLVGLALGTFYEPGWAYGLVLLVGALLALLLTVALGGWLGPRGLPPLSVPFLGVIWLLTPAAEQFHALALNERGIYWLNEMYAVGGEPLLQLIHWLNGWQLPLMPDTYLRALSSVFFQDSPLVGLLMALGLLWHSRIAFSLSVVAFLGAYAFGMATGVYQDGAINHYILGANYIMAAVAVGGVFVIPSAASYLWALLSVPVTAVLVAGLGSLLARLGLPAFSLPFCLTSQLFLYVLLLRVDSRWLPLTPIQRYSPERNLYAFTNDRERLQSQLYVHLSLPFLGEWQVTQGYDGAPTHQGEWAQALDFMLLDAEGRSYRGAGQNLADFYCYNKPVLAPADGTVVEVVSHIDDNPVGQVNTRQNWGNTVVLQHAPGLYSKVSHLRPHSSPVKPGDLVRRGELLGACGNSGRSPEPHLHFQVQATPYIGSRTLAYPLAYYLSGPAVRTFQVPAEGESVQNLPLNPLLRLAFELPPGYRLDVCDADNPAAPPQRWEVFTDAYNKTYLYCHRTGAVAYFERSLAAFSFTAFYGDESSWLYLFYRAAYRVLLSYLPGPELPDTFPLTLLRSPVLKWAQDFAAPFVRFVHPTFALRYHGADDPYHPRRLQLSSRAELRYFGRTRVLQTTDIELVHGALAGLRVQLPHQSSPLRLVCQPVA
ncbi:urea transporter [Hymenobacter gummosus]|uniref:urea transporter n=1 Tax=Hymenobacter gummosus TaxID=1776032 RepID=UPI001404A75E|nr:urea transporter [Hymenobacter gummosus]